MRLALFALYALAPGWAQEERGAERAPVLAERVEIAGMQAVIGVSRLVYSGYEDRPHELVALYAFPDRAKWYRSLIGGAPEERQVEYRSGDACWRLDPASQVSRRLGTLEQDELVRRMELRRALLSWPHGFEWVARGPGAKRAELGALGHLEAELGEDGLPERLGSFDALGEPAEGLVEITWRDSEPASRPVPASLALEQGGALVWRETLTEVSTRARLLDFQFVPPDRPQFRELPPSRERRGLAGRDQELAAREVRRTPLEAEASLSAAVARAAELRAEAAAALPSGRSLARGVELELTLGGRPQAVLVTLAGEPGPEPPPGFARVDQERVRALSVDHLPPEPAPPSDALGAVLAELAGGLPAGRQPGTPRLWFDPARPGEPRGLRLLLPLR